MDSLSQNKTNLFYLKKKIITLNSRTQTKEVHLDKTNEFVNLVQSHVLCMIKWTSSYILNELSRVWFIVFCIIYCGYRRCRRRRDELESLCENISWIREMCMFGVGGWVYMLTVLNECWICETTQRLPNLRV